MTEIFNAWSDVWLPVLRADGQADRLSVKEFFEQAHELSGLGHELTPIDRDSLFRFLPAVGAVILRLSSDDEESPRLQFPVSGIEAFERSFQPLFDLSGERNGGRPFLQRWDRSPADIEQLLGRRKGLDKILSSLEQLHPHEPGGSSSQWAVRRASSDALDWPTVTRLLVTAWFQTRNGNGKDPWGGRQPKGSAATWHVNPMAVYYCHPSNFVATMLANMHEAWLERSDLPVFLDHEGMPGDFASAQKTSIYRFTYARSLPLLYIQDGSPLGFVIGADSGIPIPTLGANESESLGLIHEHDITRLYIEQKPTQKQPNPEPKPRGSFGTRPTTTIGFERWFRVEYGVVDALNTNRRIPRILEPADDWELLIFSETSDGKGTRTWADWSSAPLMFVGPKEEQLAETRRLFEFTMVCSRKMRYGSKLAVGDSSSNSSPFSDSAVSTLFTNIQPVVSRLIDVVANDGQPDSMEFMTEIRRIAIVTFSAVTAPLLTLDNVVSVANARGYFARETKKELDKYRPAKRLEQVS